jgi:hypothetical protein
MADHITRVSSDRTSGYAGCTLSDNPWERGADLPSLLTRSLNKYYPKY